MKGSSFVSYLKIITLPSSSLILAISCPKIPQFFGTIFEKKQIFLGGNEKQINNGYSLIFPINVRQCMSGEIFISDLSM